MVDQYLLLACLGRLAVVRVLNVLRVLVYVVSWWLGSLSEHIVTPSERTNTLILRWRLLTHLQSAVLILVKLHLSVELFSLVKDLH